MNDRLLRERNDRLLRERLIAAGLLRPNTRELDPIQLPPGTVVFRRLAQ